MGRAFGPENKANDFRRQTNNFRLRADSAKVYRFAAPVKPMSQKRDMGHPILWLFGRLYIIVNFALDTASSLDHDRAKNPPSRRGILL